MFHNIRVDVIYYKTNTDFEMEFNLCGCCRMRLLTDKAADRKIMVQSLARAVSRSKIIISVGPLFGEEGVISTVANAIGKELEVVSNKKFGINTASEIKVIEGAVPLVTPDGIFGGCIIESGPQTMVLLTESKNIRKAIMEDLIHPYIEEIYASEVLQNKADTTNNQIPETEEVQKEETAETSENDEKREKIDANIIVPLGIDITPTVLPVAPSLDITTGLDSITEIKESKIELYVEEEQETAINPEDLILDEAAAETDDEEVLPDIAAEELISDVDEEYQSEIDDHIQLVHEETEEVDPIELEVPNLIMDAEHDESAMLEDELEGIVMEEDEEEAEFRFPEEQRELYHTIDEIETDSRQEPNPQDNEFLTDENLAEKRINKLDTPILALTILLFIIFVVIGYFAFYIPYTQGVSASEFIKEIYETLFK